jgi:4-hydroxy-4-methyl-2-oxoglutarate aldolase
MTAESLPPGLLEELRGLSTCVVASAIETFGVRLPNTGFADSRVRCIFPDLPAIVGYAATARICSSAPPLEGGSYYWRTDWWKELLKLPAPRVVVMQDVDDTPGLGAFVGEVHANILKALGCAGVVTNGAVRDVPGVHAIQFPMFAGNISVSHAYAHLSGFGETIEVGGLKISPGDLLLADVHGVVSIPLEIAARVPQVARQIQERRQSLIGLCRSERVTIEILDESCRKLGVMKSEASDMPKSGSKRGGS